MKSHLLFLLLTLMPVVLGLEALLASDAAPPPAVAEPACKEKSREPAFNAKPPARKRAAPPPASAPGPKRVTRIPSHLAPLFM